MPNVAEYTKNGVMGGAEWSADEAAS